MKKWVVYIGLFLGITPGGFAQDTFGVANSGQSDPFTSEFIESIFAAQVSANKELKADFQETFAKNLAHFRKKQKRSANNEQLLRHVFFSLHRKSLKRYKQYTSFAEMTESKRYDCLTASTLYAMYLRELGYTVNIVETEYHVYLKVKTSDTFIVLETTDPLEGFITETDYYNARNRNNLSSGANSQIEGVSSNQENLYGPVINDCVSVRELVGLHYYNRAIAFWNNKQVNAAREAISIAYSYYPSTRIQDLKKFFQEPDSAPLLARGRKI